MGTMVGGDTDVLSHLADGKVQDAGDLAQGSIQGRAPLRQDVSFRSARRELHLTPRARRRQLIPGEPVRSLNSGRTVLYAIASGLPWTRTPFPLPQGTHMLADMSRDSNSGLFSTSVDALFGGADRIRFVSLSPPKHATVGGNKGLVFQVQWETRETAPVHLPPHR